MRFLKKYNLPLGIFFLLSLLYFTIRISTLLQLPIFTDEAIYIRWAQVGSQDANWRFISLTDGKQPLFTWLVMLTVRIFSDPLFAGRIVSVFAGFLTLIGLFFLTYELFRKYKIALISSVLYVFYPFALVYDRMALYDSSVGTFAVWGLYCIVLLVRYIRLDVALLLGIVSGLGVLNKTNGFFTVYLLPFSLILFNWKNDKRIVRFLKWLGLSIIAVILTYGIYAILRLSPFFYIIGQKNALFVFPFKEWLQHPFTFFWGNLWAGMRDWLIRYFSFPFLILTVISFVIQRKYFKEKLLLLIWCTVPFFALALFGNTLYPRYIFFMTLSLLPLVAFSLHELFFTFRYRMIGLAVTIPFLLIPLWTFLMVLIDFPHSPIPASDRDQYNNDWPSGVGIKESIAFLKEKERGNHITLFTQGTFGLMPYAYEIYTKDESDRFTIKGIWPIEHQPPKDLLNSAKKGSTYVVFYQPCVVCEFPGAAPDTWPITEIKRYKKVDVDRYLILYKVNP